jgi:hypothetical protein
MPDYWLLPYLGQTVTTIHPNKRNKNKKDNMINKILIYETNEITQK